MLAQRITRRKDLLVRALTTPRPSWHKKVPEDVQVQKFDEQVASGELLAMRQEQGGPFPDDQVDAYVAQMLRLKHGRDVEKVARMLFGGGDDNA